MLLLHTLIGDYEADTGAAYTAIFSVVVAGGAAASTTTTAANTPTQFYASFTTIPTSTTS